MLRSLFACLTAVAVMAAPVSAIAADDPFYGTKTRTSAEQAAKTTEVLVDKDDVTVLPASPFTGRRAVEIQNLGPNPIFCCVAATATSCTPVLNKSRKVSANPDSTWALDVGSGVTIRCLASTADQVTGAATIVTELR